MCSVLARMLPKTFRGIEFWGVGWQLVNFEPMAIGFEPTPDIGIFMVGGVVLNEYRATPSVRPRQLFEKCEIGGSIEDRVLSIVEPGAPEFNRAQDLHTLAFSGYRDFWRKANAAPSRMQCRILSEAGFVSENQRPVLRARFF